MKSPRFVAALFLLGALGGRAYADRQLWLQPGLGVQPAKRIAIDFTAQTRFDQDISRVAAFLPEASVTYRVKKWLRVASGYRFEYERNNKGELVVRHRIVGDVRLRWDKKPIRVDYRLRLVEQIRPSSKDQLRTVLRNRIGMEYRASKRWIPGADVEAFHALGDLDRLEHDRLRLTAGVTHSRRDHDVLAFFRVELYTDPQQATAYIVGLAYHYQL